MIAPPETDGGPPTRIVIVCLGNICRSPMAAAVLRHWVHAAGLADQVEVGSAGTGGWHVGGPADERAAATLRRHGYDDSHVARQFVRHDFADADLILGADASNVADLRALARTPDEAAKIRLLRSFDPEAPDGAEVPDPYYGGERGFDEVLAQIEAACTGVVDALRAGRLEP